MKKYLNKLYFILGAVFIALFVIFTQGGIIYWKQGLDLNGGVRLLYKMDFSQYEKNYKDELTLQQQKSNVIGIVTKNIDSRVSKLGVSDYNTRHIVLGGEDYIEVSLGGIDDIEGAKKLIGKTVKMTFKVPFDGALTPDIKNERQILAEKILTSLKKGDITSIQDYLNPTRAWNITTSEKTFTGGNLESTFQEGIASSLTGAYVYPSLIEDEDSFNLYQFTGKKDGEYNFMEISVNFKPFREDAKIDGKLLNGERFKMATVERTQTGEPAVAIYFDDIGRKMFGDLTKKYLKKQMAIFIGDKLITDPVIQTEIYGGVAQITGRFTPKQASELAENLNTGAMPISLDLQQEEKVAPVLGEKALNNSLIAACVGIILILLMFVFFYGLKYALITAISLGIFFIILGGFIKLFGIVLSLSAIGAILLNIGMAVDANVIIFERIKEELKRGSSLITAIQIGYENSLSAIRDGNLTTGFIAFLLFMIGTNIFKGFGTMMIINIFIVLFIMVPSIPALLYLFESKKAKR